MKNIYQWIILALLSVLSISNLSAESSNPFAGQSYRGKLTRGKTDNHFYVGGGISNLGRLYIPLEKYDSYRKEYDLSSSFDFIFGFGHFVTDLLAFGLESGVSVNWNDTKRGRGYLLKDVSSIGGFWSHLTPKLLTEEGYDIDKDVARLSLTTVEIPLRFYTKLAGPGNSFKWFAIQGFVGFDLVFTNASTDIYTQNPSGSYWYSQSREDIFFAPAFTAGARLSLAFIGIEYSYHLGLDKLYGGWNYYKNRSHRISIGFTINTAL